MDKTDNAMRCRSKGADSVKTLNEDNEENKENTENDTISLDSRYSKWFRGGPNPKLGYAPVVCWCVRGTVGPKALLLNRCFRRGPLNSIYTG